MNFFLALVLVLFPLVTIIFKRRRLPSQHRVPPGSLGLPLIGQSLGLLRAMRANTAERWIEERVKKYGPISKLSLFGKPTVFIYGQDANKLVFASSNGSSMTNQQTQSIRMILGDRCLLELNGEDNKRVRGALASFLKPESLKMYVGKMEDEVRTHVQMHWEGKQQVTHKSEYGAAGRYCALLFGIESVERRNEYVQQFQEMIRGMWSIPVNLPFTRFNGSLKASAKVQNLLKVLLQEKKQELLKGAPSNQELISCLLSIHGEDSQDSVSEDEIIHNVMLIMAAGHDTSSVLITFILRVLANNPTVYELVLKEQDEIAKSKSSGEHLTWQDLTKMKYTWKVALETLRVYPPIFGGFRKTVKEIEFGGYIIPKGWQIFWITSMTHEDKNIFHEPEKFDPDRFDNQASIPPYCFVPFGAGPRICPGYEFAKIETLVTLHHLVTRFKWTLCCNDNFFKKDPMPNPTKGMPVQLTPRTLI